MYPRRIVASCAALSQTRRRRRRRRSPDARAEVATISRASWLPSFCCSPSSGRCGTVSGVRVFAGSPCQRTVVEKKCYLERKKIKNRCVCCGLIWFEEVAGKFSFPVDAAKWVYGEAVPQTRRQPKLLRGKCYIPIHAPYTHTPPPRSSSSRLGGKKMFQDV